MTTDSTGRGLLSATGTFLTLRGVGNVSATGYMLIAVLGFSLLPVFVALGARDTPFLFAAALRVGAVVGFALFMALLYRRLFFSTNTWKMVGVRLLRSPLSVGGRVIHSPLPIILATIGHLEYTFFALSTQYIDIAVATVIFEIWPIILVWLSGRIFVRYNVTSREVYFLSIVGFIGIIFVALSEFQGGDLGVSERFSELLGTSQLGIGFILITVALLMAPLIAFGGAWTWVEV